MKKVGSYSVICFILTLLFSLLSFSCCIASKLGEVILPALLEDDVSAIKMAIDTYKIDINQPILGGYNSLFCLASGTCAVNIVKYLVEEKGASVNSICYIDNYKVSPLYSASYSLMTFSRLGDVKIKRDKNGADVHAPNAAIRCMYLIDYLIRHGANVNERFVDGTTFLFNVVASGFSPIVEKVFRSGISLDITDDEGRTLMDYTICISDDDAREDMISLLKEHNVSKTWIYDFYKYVPHSYSCNTNIQGSLAIVSCNSFEVYCPVTDLSNFYIKSDISHFLKERITSLNKNRFSTLPDDQLLTSLVRWVIKKTPTCYFDRWFYGEKSDDGVIAVKKAILVMHGLKAIVDNKQLTVIDNILKNFATEKF
jgi:ankyrin repeat protein